MQATPTCLHPGGWWNKSGNLLCRIGVGRTTCRVSHEECHPYPSIFLKIGLQTLRSCYAGVVQAEPGGVPGCAAAGQEYAQVGDAPGELPGSRASPVPDCGLKAAVRAIHGDNTFPIL